MSSRKAVQAPEAIMEKFRTWLKVRRQRSLANAMANAAPLPGGRRRPRVLVAGIYLANYSNHSKHLVTRFAASTQYDVEQLWVAIGNKPADPAVERVTAQRFEQKMPKFAILNRLLGQLDLDRYDFLVFTDDDITVPHGFLDAYLSWVEKYQFSIAQPARARHSYKSHRFVLQRKYLRARQTRFVEIGPVFSFDRRAVRELLPFDEGSPMGWGYDYVWPIIAERVGMKMGIIDATPVDHSHRAQTATYGLDENNQMMKSYLESNLHLTRAEAMRTTRRHFV